MSSPDATAQTADRYLRHAQMRATLLDIFARRRPPAAELERVTQIADFAVETVAAAGSDSPTDFAECACLYGWALGQWQARRELEAPR
ncbi:MAG TPA: hypothetical protein VFL91_10305 [Thermomicrobiales bacterium]|nr:hypothetical protein [Thermomicrobiales bacterium]